MKLKLIFGLIALIFLSSCVGTSSTGIFEQELQLQWIQGLQTQIDDSIMDKSLDAKLISMNKSYLLNVKQNN